jgi:hypothetical protein
LQPSLLLATTAVAKDVPTTEKKIADYEADLGQAMIQRDIATLSKLVGDDWTIQATVERWARRQDLSTM